MTEKVRVIRYIRPQPKAEAKSNLGGGTLVFDMDYEQRKVDVFMSVCDTSDNFNKKLAVELAIEAGSVQTHNLDNFRKVSDMVGGFTDTVFVTMLSRYVEGTISRREKTFLRKVDVGTWR